MTRLFVTTATGSLGTDAAPVGGGVTVLEGLEPHLARAFDLTVLRAAGQNAVVEKDGVRRVDLCVASLAGRPPDAFLHLPERAYARFALEWEAVLGRYFDGVEPAGALVLANDVSEGPPFARLAARGFLQAVLYHVCVAAFFARRYLRVPGGPALPPGAAARAWRTADRLGLAGRLPGLSGLLGLVWRKEGEAARHAAAIVPSDALAGELARCYPGSGVEERTLVSPWGVIGAPDPARRSRRDEALRALGLDPGRRVVLSLSRVSPEKRLELAARALLVLERDDPGLADGLAWVVAGAPAYMNGARTLARLRRLAARLDRVDVRLAGYVTGDVKWDLLAAADAFLSTSSYEAYGLSIAQALASGTPVVAADHQGARAIVQEGFGRVVPARAADLARALRAELALDARDAADRRERAARFGAEHPFAASARRVVGFLEAEATRRAGAAPRAGAAVT